MAEQTSAERRLTYGPRQWPDEKREAFTAYIKHTGFSPDAAAATHFSGGYQAAFDANNELQREIDALRQRIAELEGRLDWVTNQACEECGRMVDDAIEETGGHSAWWLCGHCANERARKTSGRIAELEGALERLVDWGYGDPAPVQAQTDWADARAVLARTALAREPEG